MIDFLLKHPTVPLIALGALVAFLSWKSQQKLTRAKHSIDLQNNYICSERVLKDMYHVAELTKKLSAADIDRLSQIDALTPATDDERQNLEALRNVLNCFERMAIGIQQKVYDEHLLFNSYATFVIEVSIAFRPYIKAKRVGNSAYYSNFDWLTLKWRTWRDAERKRSKQ